MRHLTMKQRKFVKELMQGKSATQAVKDAGYNVTNPRSADVIGGRLVRNELVQSELAKELAKLYPDLGEKMAKTIDKLLDSDKEAIQLKALEYLSKVRGDFAPQKKATVNASIKLPKE